MKIATVKWPGFTFQAEPLREVSDGVWEMRSLQETARFVRDRKVRVKAIEIVSITETEEPDNAVDAN